MRGRSWPKSVASGLVRPSRDEEARLRYLAYQTMGALLVQFLMTPEPDRRGVRRVPARRSSSDTILPMLELFTEGLLADRRMLDDYLEYLRGPGAPQDPDPRVRTSDMSQTHARRSTTGRPMSLAVAIRSRT